MVVTLTIYVIDCADASDEDPSICDTPGPCKDHYVPCNTSGQCIPESWVCDGESDCIGGTDENSTLCGQSNYFYYSTRAIGHPI